MKKPGAAHILAAVLAGRMACSPAMAGTQTDPVPQLQALVKTPQYQDNIARLFAQLPPDVFQRCPTLVSNGSSVTVMAPATFAADGSPVAGAWRQSFPVSGCGNDTTINLFFAARPDKRILSVVAAPGDTHAGLVLQKDTMGYVMIAAQAKARGCAALRIRTTRYDGPLENEPARADASGHAIAASWHETWTVSACGQFYRVPVTFVPDATGTRIEAAPATATDR